MRALRLGVITALMLIVSVATAQSAQRYAVPSGGVDSGNCPKEVPCNLNRAILKATSGDEVIIASGSYATTEPLVPETEVEKVSIHGDFGAAAPIITTSSAEIAVFGISGDGSVLSWVDVRSTGTLSVPVSCQNNARVERVKALATAATAISISRCTVVDTLAVSRRENGGAISGSVSSAATSSITNSTAIATGPGSYGIRVNYIPYEGPGKFRLNLSNSIAEGAGGDLNASGVGDEFAEIVASYSNFDKVDEQVDGVVVEGLGNQKAPPLFVNAADGDYAEAPGSPTIDAGLVGPGIGSLDLAGNPRTLGATVDIGAYEFIPPPPPPPVIPPVIGSLKVTPMAFKAANFGGAVVSAKGKGKAKGPVTAKVSYSLNVAATTTFTVARKAVGRKAGKKCVKQSKANKGKAKCTLLTPVKGGFTHAGAAGANSFTFTGRLGSKALARGSYVLTGQAGTSSKSAGFKIVK